jgi:hypothetical protein
MDGLWNTCLGKTAAVRTTVRNSQMHWQPRAFHGSPWPTVGAHSRRAQALKRGTRAGAGRPREGGWGLGPVSAERHSLSNLSQRHRMARVRKNDSLKAPKHSRHGSCLRRMRPASTQHGRHYVITWCLLRSTAKATEKPGPQRTDAHCRPRWLATRHTAAHTSGTAHARQRRAATGEQGPLQTTRACVQSAVLHVDNLHSIIELNDDLLRGLRTEPEHRPPTHMMKGTL